MTQLDLDAIEARANAATPGPWTTDGWEIYQGDGNSAPDLMKWVGETCRADDYDGSQNDAAFIAHARTDVPAMAAEIRRLRARVTELERPAVERQRNEIRQSFTALSAQASQDGDHEGAFSLDCQLREREEQWAREDAAVEAHVVADDSDDPEHTNDRGRTA
ncbi:hypothetical protein ACL07V_37570 [Streptomyces sp. MB22_4]|uniref:hypothetical protein n=1 Tax=Streptomyces sp. MB22_4 TaxID=3383120 RepID=UPI0039A055E9